MHLYHQIISILFCINKSGTLLEAPHKSGNNFSTLDTIDTKISAYYILCIIIKELIVYIYMHV